jgi:glycerophosphoryl diester phosphodiesterase
MPRLHPYPRLAALGAASVVALGTLTASATATADRADAAPSPSVSGPLVIGHRGASGYRPEHTLAAYELAIRLGADYIEPDLVNTADGVLVARHENEISATTDVADHPEFAGRKTTKVIDGISLTGWFTEDFTLAELKTLRARERIPALRPRNTLYDGRYQVPTLQEVIDLARRAGHELGREIGIYPETKHPTYFGSIGLPLGPPLVATLAQNGLNWPTAKVFVQSFEVGNLRALDPVLRVPLVQLFSATGKPYDFVVSGDPRTYADLATPAGLREIAGYADGIGPDKNQIVPRDASGALLHPTRLVADAHRAGLLVHPYTFRNENNFLPLDFRSGTDPAAYGDAFAEYELFFGLGVDGLFTDNADTAVEARRDHLAETGLRREAS